MNCSVNCSTHFNIDAGTRAISTSGGKITLMQYDHNSERFGFKMPQINDGHDMLKCDKVEIQYINIDKATREETRGIYEVDDVRAGEEGQIEFSWLVSQNATKRCGILSFVVSFICYAEGSTEINYLWSTGTFSNISVCSSIHNDEIIVEQYIDVLEQWRRDVFENYYTKDEVYTKTEVDEKLKDKANDADVKEIENAVFNTVDLTKCTTITAGNPVITENTIDGNTNSEVHGIIDVSGYVELVVEAVGIEDVLLTINGTEYTAFYEIPDVRDAKPVVYKGFVTEPIEFEFFLMGSAKFTKFITTSDYELLNSVHENKEEISQIKKEQAKRTNIKNALGEGSIEQTPKVEEWTPENTQIADYFKNPTDSKKLIQGKLDENGNVVIDTGVFGPYSALFSGYGQVTGEQSAIVGRRNVMLGSMAFATGNDNFMLGNYGFAAGTKNSVFSNGGFAQGGNNIVKGIYGSAMGANCEAIADASHAQNLFCKALGYGSDAGGMYTIADLTAQFVRGKYNDSVPNAIAIFGNGTSETNRKNAFYLTTGGNGWFAGDVTFTYKGKEYKASDLMTRLEALEKKLATT